MSRNNDERLGSGVKHQDSGFPLPPSTEANSTFSYVVPTEFVDLPSRGEFYPEDHPLCGKDSVEIRYMTAKDEDILTSKALLKKGVAIDRLLKNVLIDKNINPDSMLVGDRNALLVAIRVTGYGAEYKTDVACPNCGTRNSFAFDITEPEVTTLDLDLLNELGVDRTNRDTFIIELPRSKASVEVRLINGTDEKKLAARIKQRKKSKLPESNATEQFRLMIVSVNGDTNNSAITKLINIMPAIDSRYLRGVYKKLNPNIDLTQEFFCEECDFEGPMEVPFTSDFLWPK